MVSCWAKCHYEAHDCTLHSEQKLTYSLLCFTDQTSDSYLIQLCVFIHQTYVFIYEITIMIHKKHLCVFQFQFIYVHFSVHYRNAMKQTDSQPDIDMCPDHETFVSKMFLTPKSIKNLPTATPTKINITNIPKAAIIIRKVGKNFGVIKPSMRMICHGSNLQQLHILVATTYVNNRTAWQNAQTPKKQ